MNPRILLWLIPLALFFSGCSKGAGVKVAAITDGKPVVTEGYYLGLDDRDMPKITPEVIRGWRTNYDVFSTALLDAAKESQLDTNSLAAVLAFIRKAPENTDKALLPMSAQVTTWSSEAAWIVSLQWEYEFQAFDLGLLGHVRQFTVTQKGITQVAFATCD